MIVAGKRVFLTLIREVAPDTKKSGGLVLDGEVTNVAKKPVTALVAHTGEDAKMYRVNDKVYIGQFYSDEQEVEGVKYVIMKEDDIIAKL